MENKKPGDDLFDRLNVGNWFYLTAIKFISTNLFSLDYNHEQTLKRSNGRALSQSVPYFQRIQYATRTA